MDALTLTLPKEYGYVLLTATLSTVVAWWQSINVRNYRTAAKVPFPNAYASAAEAKESKEKYLFNCAQRAHANFLEHHPSMLVGLMVGGLRYPVLSAELGAAWCVTRVGYTLGYCRADKENGRGRVAWSISGSLMELGMVGMAGVAGWMLVMA